MLTQLASLWLRLLIAFPTFMTPPQRRKLKASTLLETVIGFFIIAGGMAVVAGLYASTMNTQAQDTVSSVMVTLVRSRVAELRSLAATSAGYQSLPSQAGTIAAPDYPGFQIVTQTSTQTLPYPGGGLRTIDFTNSHTNVSVKVVAPGGRNYQITTLIGAPPRQVDQLVVDRLTGSSPLGRDLSADFRAKLLDNTGAEIPDLQFTFYIDFGNGYGTLEEDPDGRKVRFTNMIANLNGPNIYTGGRIRIVARTFYAGKEYRGVSTDLDLS